MDIQSKSGEIIRTATLSIHRRQPGRIQYLVVPKETVTIVTNIMNKETYIRDPLTVDDVPVTIYRHESMTSDQILNRLVGY